MSLAPWPVAADIELIQDLSPISPPTEGFLRRHRHAIKTVLEGGLRTDTYVVDYVDRELSKRDAVGILIYAVEDGKTWVGLRRQVRYAQHLVTGQPLCLELFAGLIEPDETPAETAIREVAEEAGLELDPNAVRSLGPPFFVLPGTITERIYPFCARTSLSELNRILSELPPGDGSPFEEGAHAVVLELETALAMTLEPIQDPRGLWIADAKTELVLRRMERLLRKEEA